MPQVTEYHAAAPVSASSVSVCASSFSAAQVRVGGAPGSLRTCDLVAGGAETQLVATLHAAADGAELRRYTVHVARTEAQLHGEKVTIDHSAPAPAPAAAHGHSHNGMPCTHDHGHGHGKEAGHSHDHSHSHSHDHGHAHDGAACTDASHGHGHGHGHGHAHGEPAAPKAAAGGSHGHSHDGVPCSHDHGHGHGHGHGARDDGVMYTPPGACYAYSQDADSLSVELRVPAGTKGADVRCVIGAAQLDVAVAGQVLLQGALAGRLARDECSWSLVDDAGNRLLVLSLAKEGGARAARWGSLMA